MLKAHLPEENQPVTWIMVKLACEDGSPRTIPFYVLDARKMGFGSVAFAKL